MIKDTLSTKESVGVILKRVTPIVRKLVGWKAWYDDGTVYSSDKNSWVELPLYGIQVLMKYWYYPEAPRGELYGREVFCGHDAYIIDHNRLIDIRTDAYDFIKEVKLGKYINDDQYEAIRLKAMADKDFIGNG